MRLHFHVMTKAISQIDRAFLFIALSLLAIVPGSISHAADIDFQRDIRPILSDACFQCHGADSATRKAELRLDRRTGLSNESIVVGGKPKSSKLFRRITSNDTDVRMPPRDSKRQLTANEIQLIKEWIEQGAEWKEHWSLISIAEPKLPALPDGQSVNWVKNPIDLFVLKRLTQAKLNPSQPTDKARLARRVSLTVTGMPPSVDDVVQFQSDRTPNAYEKFVDRLLASPQYGEHAALTWLDLARYADTDGYQDDQPRVMWRWRDWLIDALNAGMPFDQFTIEMLAGDLLPNATELQRLATGFHRNHRTNGEGGSIAEEFRVEYVVDCVDTTSTVWLGLTLACSRCHDHKYDPFAQQDFYQLFAFFNNTPEKGVYRGNTSDPLIKVPTNDQRFHIDRLDRQIAAAVGDEKTLKTLQAQRKKLLDQVPSTMIMSDSQPRDTFVLLRGQYDQRGKKVAAGFPASLDRESTTPPKNRLDLARWLVNSKNPLTARVAVNRIWSMHFGTGLVRTPEDFGSQGEPPSHPQLLDWLATYFIESGWDVKGLHRLIVTSTTYRQASTVKSAEAAVDPKCRLLWRFPRHRLKAEQIRDRALAVSGLLVQQLGGPSVKPYQPAGLWDEIAGGSTGVYKGGYKEDRGPSLYRRSLYTFWRRTIPPPSMTTFDAPSRETCSARRPRTNTPLQALSLMNDVTYLECARVLGERMLLAGQNVKDCTTAGFVIALQRQPTKDESDVIVSAHKRYAARIRRSPKLAAQLVSIGASKPKQDFDAIELATYMSLGNAFLNLDEFIVVE